MHHVRFLNKYITKYCFVLFSLCGGIQHGVAQIFPGLTGETLVDALRNEYTPTHLLNDTQVKDTLYAVIFADQDTVHCIYSGLSRYLPTGVDPSQWLYGNGTETGSMNLEHSWPQAKGAGEGTGGNTNMYHLFPSRSAINSDRGDSPYTDINDNQTTRWYYRDQEMNSKPSANIDAYSEYVNGAFEPRESVKGDIARAMFYFWTIYRDNAMAADPGFFNLQLDKLCAWHELDPVDASEMQRNERIAQYQGKENPFIVDCSLVKRAYCSSLPECIPLSVGSSGKPIASVSYITTTHQLHIEGEANVRWTVQVFDELGRRLLVTDLLGQAFSEPLALPSGAYFVVAFHGNQVLTGRFYQP